VQPVPVRLVDERLTTVSANRALREAGRDARASRPVVDAAAAVVLLESALATERGTAAPPGELVAVS
jgi:putative Holliday junction resolvase